MASGPAAGAAGGRLRARVREVVRRAEGALLRPVEMAARRWARRGRRRSIVLFSAGVAWLGAGAGLVLSFGVGAVTDRRALGAVGAAALIEISGGVVVMRAVQAPQRPSLIALYRAVVGGAAALVAAVALPFLLAGTFSSPLDAVAEAASAASTTSATLLTDPGSLPRALLVWRSIAQWLGGLAVVFLIVRVLPVLGAGGTESGLGVTTRSARRLAPRLAGSVERLAAAYALFTGAAVVAFAAAGMGPVDAVVHGFSGASTGGMSSRRASLGGFESDAVEWVGIAVMLVAGTSLPLLYRVLRGGAGLRRAFEFKVYLVVVAAVAGSVWWMNGADADHDGVRAAVFSSVSAISTTGWITDELALMAVGSQTMLILAMAVGGMAASLSGGLHTARAMALASYLRREVVRQLHDRLVAPVRLGPNVVGEAVTGRIIGEVVFASMLVMVAFFVLAGAGLGLIGGVTAALSWFATCGPALGRPGSLTHLQDTEALGRVLMVVLVVSGRVAVTPVAAVAVDLAAGFRDALGFRLRLPWARRTPARRVTR